MSAGQGISFLHEFDLGNRLDENFGDNIISVTSTAPGDFDKSNLFEDSTRLRWRSVDTATQELVFKADLVSNIDTFAILGHNFSSSGAVKVQANVSNNFLAPPVDIAVPITPNNIIITSAFGAEYEYYKIIVIDPANPCGHIEIGRVVAGRSFIMTNNEDISDSYSVQPRDFSKKVNTEGFFKASNENVVSRMFSANFQKLNTQSGQDDNIVGLRNLFNNVKTTRPFLTVLDRGNPGTFNMWGQLVNIPAESFGVNQFVSLPIQIEEVF